MDFLRTFFSLNRDIIYFGYGLVFFVVGLAIALQSRTYSRLDLARSFQWLAAFGFAHGFHEWGDLFIPIQSAYMVPEAISFLHLLHLILLGISFAFLFEFGVALLRPLGKFKWLTGLSAYLFLLWFGVSFIVLPLFVGDPEIAHNIQSALARYLIGFPGGILAAYSLRKHTYEIIAPLKVPHIVRVLRFAGVMLAFYGIFAGLVVPPTPFFPGNIFNTVTFEQLFITPPPVFRSLIGLGLAIAVIRGLEIFDVETARQIEAIEQQQILNAERLRIARDIHDGAIQKVYTAGLLVESAEKMNENEVVSGRLSRAALVLNDAISDLRRNLGDLQNTPTEIQFVEAVESLAKDPRFRSLVDISLSLDLPNDFHLPATQSSHILAVLNEALSNVVRHSKARQASVQVACGDGRLSLTVEDDGIGIQEDKEGGFGMRNMRDRARLLGGKLVVNDLSGKGTRISMEIPVKEER
jgi:signal transduction histidine kinase